ncbi:MAG: winged helix-turn-helix domain-containing protein, partial [Anaerolineae bacterium]|nr:winged helix-turn-helix domain-containing protein [Anaerolineae bacterium]
HKGKLLDFSQREYMLLEYLMRNAGQVLTRTQIGERIWGFDSLGVDTPGDAFDGDRFKIGRFPCIRRQRWKNTDFGDHGPLSINQAQRRTRLHQSIYRRIRHRA